jgi:hypothetical protein
MLARMWRNWDTYTVWGVAGATTVKNSRKISQKLKKACCDPASLCPAIYVYIYISDLKAGSQSHICIPNEGNKNNLMNIHGVKKEAV